MSKEALARIEEAKTKGKTELDLSGLGLRELPPEIASLAQLTTLDLCFNQLTSLPPEIASLAQLTELYLQGNQLTSLPSEIASQGLRAQHPRLLPHLLSRRHRP